jgi:hypothetical protein
MAFTNLLVCALQDEKGRGKLTLSGDICRHAGKCGCDLDQELVHRGLQLGVCDVLDDGEQWVSIWIRQHNLVLVGVAWPYGHRGRGTLRHDCCVCTVRGVLRKGEDTPSSGLRTDRRRWRPYLYFRESIFLKSMLPTMGLRLLDKVFVGLREGVRDEEVVSETSAGCLGTVTIQLLNSRPTPAQNAVAQSRLVWALCGVSATRDSATGPLNTEASGVG